VQAAAEAAIEGVERALEEERGGRADEAATAAQLREVHILPNTLYVHILPHTLFVHILPHTLYVHILPHT